MEGLQELLVSISIILIIRGAVPTVVMFGEGYTTASFGQRTTTSSDDDAACCEQVCKLEHQVIFIKGIALNQLRITLKWSRETICTWGACEYEKTESRLTDDPKCEILYGSPGNPKGFNISSKAEWKERQPTDKCDPPPTGFWQESRFNPQESDCKDMKKEGEYDIYIRGNEGTKKTKGCSSLYGGTRTGAAPFHGQTQFRARKNGWTGEESVSGNEARAMIADALKRLAKKCPDLAASYYKENQKEICERAAGGGRTKDEEDQDFSNFKADLVCPLQGQYVRNTGRSVPDPTPRPPHITLGGLFGTGRCPLCD